MEDPERKRIQQTFIRVCRDGGFFLDHTTAAQITARVLGIHPIDIWIAVGDLRVMELIAAGRHPAARTATTQETDHD